MSPLNETSPFDNLLLQTLMGRLQVRPTNTPFLSQSLDDLLNASHLTDEVESDDSRSQFSKEEDKLEKEIIRIIISGRTDMLKANSGQAVTINDHHICVGYHEDTQSDYRVWEWHGHIMIFDEENGYSPEYIYGNYFERLPLRVNEGLTAKREEKEEEKVENQGLKELIDGGEPGRGRILHRNINAGSPRF